MDVRFPFRFDPAYRRLARLFGVTPERAWVHLREDAFEARYGPWRATGASASPFTLRWQESNAAAEFAIPSSP